MLHSKFSTSYDASDRSVTIRTQFMANNQNQTVSRTFFFDQQGKLILDDLDNDRASFLTIAKLVKTTIPKFKAYLEDGFKDQGNAQYEVVRETLYNEADIHIGYSVILLKNGECIDETKEPRSVENITSYGIVDYQVTFSDVDYASDCFYNESKLIQNM